MADQCSICLEALDGGVAALACGHRFHAACLASMAGAVGTASSTSRRGTLTACPNCRTTSRVAPVTSAPFSVGDRVLALWGHKWFPGDVYAVKDGGSAYEIAWDDEDSSNTIPASRVRAAPLTVDVDAATAREVRPAAMVAPRAAPPVTLPVAPPAPPASKPKTSRFTGVSRDKRHRIQETWRAEIRVRGSYIPLGFFDVEEDAARAYDAALIKYRNAPTVNFPGEAPLASVLAALPVAPLAPPPTAPPRRSGRAPAPRVIVDPEVPNIRDQKKDRTRRTAPAKQSVPPRDAAKTISSSVCRACKREFGSKQARAAHLGGAPACRALLGLPPLPLSQYVTAGPYRGKARAAAAQAAPAPVQRKKRGSDTSEGDQKRRELTILPAKDQESVTIYRQVLTEAHLVPAASNSVLFLSDMAKQMIHHKIHEKYEGIGRFKGRPDKRRRPWTCDIDWRAGEARKFKDALAAHVREYEGKNDEIRKVNGFHLVGWTWDLSQPA